MADLSPTTSSRVTPPPSYPKVPWAYFLESVAPGQYCLAEIALSMRKDASGLPGQMRVGLSPPAYGIGPVEIQLHCSDGKCGGVRSFATTNFIPKNIGAANLFLTYSCRNCGRWLKIFALRVTWLDNTDDHVLVAKFGEMPNFGPPVPARLISLVGPDRELFLRGRRAENQGLGIGAFAYYRRVIENQKTRLIQQIGKVAARLNPTHPATAEFEMAVKESQFSRAIDTIADVFPEKLMIKGQNPLRLLHSTTSEGLHALGEEECLQRANAVRVILVELADRIATSLKDDAEIERAVATLMAPPDQAEPIQEDAIRLEAQTEDESETPTDGT